MEASKFFSVKLFKPPIEFQYGSNLTILMKANLHVIFSHYSEQPMALIVFHSALNNVASVCIVADNAVPHARTNLLHTGHRAVVVLGDKVCILAIGHRRLRVNDEPVLQKFCWSEWL